MENLIAALELRVEAIAEEIEAIEAFADEMDESNKGKIYGLLLRIGRHVPYVTGVDP